MRKKYQTPLLSAALIALATPSAMAVPEPTPIVAPQPQGLCTGTVLDENGDPMIGATVKVEGTSNAAMTNVDGLFSLKDVKPGSTLVFSYIGYEDAKIVWNGQPVSITMKTAASNLDEVVVVGYGQQKKVNMTGSVAQVDSKALENRPVQNISSAIQGMMPGVQVTTSSGRPGQDGGTIRVRGVGTLNSSDPYILVDGVETGTINSIDPNDIESISVLKDAASAAIYGSKASNGVILITTKRGKEGKARVSYNGYVGLQRATEMIDRISSYDYARLYNEAQKAEGLNPRFSDDDLQKFKDGSSPYTHPNTDWYGEAYKTGFQQSHNVSVNGGTENAHYMGSVGYMSQSGILPNAERHQFNGRTNLDVKINSRLTGRLNLAYIHNDYTDPNSSYAGGSSDQIIRQLNRIAPWIVSRYEDGTWGTISDGSPIAWLDVDQTVDRRNQNFSGTLSADYKIIDGLLATLTGSYVNNQQHYRAFQKFIQYNANKKSDPNKLNENFYGWHRATFEALLNYNKSFGSHNLKALAGWHTEKYDYRDNSTERKNFPTNDLTDMNAGDASTQKASGYTRELSMISWFGRINYDYASKYLFEANFRADASSRFAKGHRWGYFPSFSGAWRISEESFMEDARGWLNNLKLRASWGKLGNQNALSDYYPWMNTYNLGASYPLGGSLLGGYYQANYKLATISWEKARTWGIGFDLTALNNRVNLTFDYYDRKTTGIIMDVPVPQEFGLGAYKDNVGAMTNRGVEVILGYNNRWGDWSFSATGNFAYNKNILQDLDLPEGNSEMNDPNNGNMIRRIGHALNTYRVYKADGFFESDEAAQAYMDKYAGQPGYPFSKKFKGGDIIYKDTNGDGKITAADRVLAGSTDPKFTYGLNINVGWKDFDLTMMLSGAAGVSRMINKEVTGYFAGDDSHPATVWLDAWTPTNKNATMPRTAYDESSNNYTASTFWVQNSSYLRMKNLQFGYSIPKAVIRHIGCERIRVYYSAENLFTIHDMLVSVDPELNSERASHFPLTQTHAFGVNIIF